MKDKLNKDYYCIEADLRRNEKEKYLSEFVQLQKEKKRIFWKLYNLQQDTEVCRNFLEDERKRIDDELERIGIEYDPTIDEEMLRELDELMVLNEKKDDEDNEVKEQEDFISSLDDLRVILNEAFRPQKVNQLYPVAIYIKMRCSLYPNVAYIGYQTIMLHCGITRPATAKEYLKDLLHLGLIEIVREYQKGKHPRGYRWV